MTAFPTYPPIENLAAPHPENLRLWIPRLTTIVNGILAGRMNVTGEFTLTVNQASTTISDARIAFSSALLPIALTANAAAVVASLYVPSATVMNGSAVIQHPNNANTDKTFRFAVLG